VGLRIANRRFSPSVLGVVLTLIGVSLFVRLGVWQLHRADEKRALIAQYTAGAEHLVEISADNASSLPRYQHVHALGHYDSAHQILLDNMPSQSGRAGFRVVTPFVLESGAMLLVDRGWMPLGVTRQDVPQVAVSDNARAIAGRFDELPRAGIELAQPNVDQTAPWPRIMNFPQHEVIERALGRNVVRGLVLLDPDQADGYEREWQQIHLSFGPERHIAYAVQWFGLAAAALIMFLILSFRRDSPDERTADSPRH
jgi:surfeit locus 1 family protein